MNTVVIHILTKLQFTLCRLLQFGVYPSSKDGNLKPIVFCEYDEVVVFSEYVLSKRLHIRNILRGVYLSLKVRIADFLAHAYEDLAFVCYGFSRRNEIDWLSKRDIAQGRFHVYLEALARQ